MKIVNFKINNILIFFCILIYASFYNLALSSEKVNIFENELNTIESYYWIGLEEKGNYELFLKALKKIETLEKKIKKQKRF